MAHRGAHQGQNIDDFNRGMALILAHSYARFPIPAVVKVAEPDPYDDLLPEETERRESRHAVLRRSGRSSRR
ncbi:hypothetical protein BH18PSE1_BH18PSE1_12670 [soil metagenome]